MRDDGIRKSVSGMISLYAAEKLKQIAQERCIPHSRMIAIAVDHELERDNPFLLDASMPEDELIELAYVEEAGRIIQYLTVYPGLPLDDLILQRHDIGIPDSKTLLLAFREALAKGMLEAYKPKQPPWASVKYPEDYFFYRVKRSKQQKTVRKSKEADEYETYLKLQKKFRRK